MSSQKTFVNRKLRNVVSMLLLTDLSDTDVFTNENRAVGYKLIHHKKKKKIDLHFSHFMTGHWDLLHVSLSYKKLTKLSYIVFLMLRNKWIQNDINELHN